MGPLCILGDEISYFPFRGPHVHYCLSSSSRLQDPESPLAQAFTEKELRKYKESVDEPCREQIMTDELQKKADKVLLPGDKCQSCKRRAVRISDSLRTVYFWYYPTHPLFDFNVVGRSIPNTAEGSH